MPDESDAEAAVSVVTPAAHATRLETRTGVQRARHNLQKLIGRGKHDRIDLARELVVTDVVRTPEAELPEVAPRPVPYDRPT